MITAKEARALYNQCGAEAERFLANIEPKIIESAKLGKRSVFFHIDSEEVSKLIYSTPLQVQVLDRLYRMGYNIQFTRYGESYVLRGLADNDGNIPIHTNCGLAIHW